MGNSSLTRLFRRAAPALAIAAMLALAAYADAAAGPRPGLWKVTTRVSREGVTSEPNSQSSCVTADQMKDPSRSLMPPQSPDEKCTRTQYEWTGSKLTWRIQCNGRMATSGGGDIDFDTPEHYHDKITSSGSVNGHDFASTILLEGERVGECPNPSP
jgi:Protein of unknown function (DUF3617)